MAIAQCNDWQKIKKFAICNLHCICMQASCFHLHCIAHCRLASTCKKTPIATNKKIWQNLQIANKQLANCKNWQNKPCTAIAKSKSKCTKLATNTLQHGKKICTKTIACSKHEKNNQPKNRNSFCPNQQHCNKQKANKHSKNEFATAQCLQQLHKARKLSTNRKKLRKQRQTNFIGTCIVNMPKSMRKKQNKKYKSKLHKKRLHCSKSTPKAKCKMPCSKRLATKPKTQICPKLSKQRTCIAKRESNKKSLQAIWLAIATKKKQMQKKKQRKIALQNSFAKTWHACQICKQPHFQHCSTSLCTFASTKNVAKQTMQHIKQQTASRKSNCKNKIGKMQKCMQFAKMHANKASLQPSKI